MDELRKEVVVLETPNWKDIYEYLKLPKRTVKHTRNTNETKIDIELNLDGTGKANITYRLQLSSIICWIKSQGMETLI